MAYIRSMQMPRYYNQAPISEAVIDLRVNLPENTPLDLLANIHPEVKSDYPERGEQHRVLGAMSFGNQVNTSATQKHIGYVFSNPESKQLFQARLDGFTVGKLAPYHGWDLFRAEAVRLWNIYRMATHPLAITRIAVRYINRLDLPLPSGDLEEYLKTAPRTSPDLPQALSGFFMQLQVPQDDLKAMLVLNEALVPPPSADSVSVLLDIDLFRVVDLPADEEGVWALLDQLRLRKNEVFEACITDRTRELIS